MTPTRSAGVEFDTDLERGSAVQMLKYALVLLTAVNTYVATAVQLLHEWQEPEMKPGPIAHGPESSESGSSGLSPDSHDSNEIRQYYAFTSRQYEIIWLLAVEGLSNRKIARRLNIAESTVKAHMHAIFVKLGVTDRSDAVLRTFGNDVRRYA